MSGSDTRSALRRLATPLLVGSTAGWAALGVGGAALLLGVAAWAVRLGLVSAPYWVFVAWALALVLVAGIVRAAGLALAGLSLAGLARRLEDLGAWRRGAVTALLGEVARGTSGPLLAAADRTMAAELAHRGRAAAEPIARPVRSLGLAGMLALGVGLAAFASAGPVRGSAAALWHPRRAWEATVAPVRLVASAMVIDRGGSVDFRVEAVGRRAATVWLRGPGEPWRSRAVRLDSLGRATLPSGPLTGDLFARATSGTRASDTVRVRVRLPVFLGSLSVTARYPAYLGLEDESLPTGGDTLLLPAGTRLATRGETTAPLARAAWVGAGRSVELTVAGATFRGTFVPASSGEYRLTLATAGGTPLTGEVVRLPIRVVADSAPRVEVPVPGADTTAPLNLLVPLVIDVRDDHGVTAVAVESRRISRQGLADSARRETVPLPEGKPDRAILSHTLDLNRRGLLPGDTVRYVVTATDDAPARHRARSREFVLRLPTMAEVRAAEREASQAVASGMDSVVAESRRVERETADLAREQPRSGFRATQRQAQTLSYEEAKRAEGAARAQQGLLDQAERLRESLDRLWRRADAAGLGDTAWARQLDEIRSELERALSPELRQNLAALRQALKNLDASQTQAALEELAEAQKRLREALERSRELFRRAALEGDLANLGQEARDLAREQRQWAEAVPAADSSRASRTERDLAARAESLATALGEAASAAAPPSLREARERRLEAAGGEAGKAAKRMRQASASAASGRRSQAQREGEQAARALDPLSDELAREREAMQRAWREETVKGLDQALAETGRLAERQLAVEQELRGAAEPGAAVRSEQAAVEEGVQKLLDQVRRAAGQNALVPPQIGAALGSASQQMRDAREAIASAVPNGREAAELAGGAVDALNAAAHQLLRARGDVAGAKSGSGMAEALERMAELARQQGGLGQQGQGLLPLAGVGAIQEQIRRLGARQRALAEELEKLRSGEDLPGASELAEEARDLARRMESGQLDRRTVERQGQLFRRMLDAGRTLQGSEEDERKERASTTPKSDSVRVPSALRARLEAGDRLRVPGWEELQRLSPEERRLVVDYFRRLSATGGN